MLSAPLTGNLWFLVLNGLGFFHVVYFGTVFIIFERNIVECFRYPLSYLYFVYPVVCIHAFFLYVELLIVESAVFRTKPVFSVETEIFFFFQIL